MRKLYIPENINLRREVIPGVGTPELFKILIVAVPGVLVCILMSEASENPFAAITWLLAILGWVFLSFAIFARFAGNASVWQLLMRWKRYYREQEEFYYREEEKAYEVYTLSGCQNQVCSGNHWIRKDLE